MDHQFELLKLLNYDTNTEQFLSYPERLFIHRAIAKYRNGFQEVTFPASLKDKIYNVKEKMYLTQWKYIHIRIGQDRIPYQENAFNYNSKFSE